MDTSTSERQVLLSTNNKQAEILLLDGGFSVLARGPSPLGLRVSPGLYEMKVKVGDEETEELLVVEADDKTFEKFLVAPEFESPIPLADTSTTHEYHQAVANRFLQPSAASLSLGAGSAVMICVRDPSKTNFSAMETSASSEDREAYAASFKGFRILDATGSCIVDLDAMAEHNTAAGYMALAVDLTPGCYSLAYSVGSEWICSSLPTVNGWTLQVYINVLPSGRGRFQLVPDLSGMAMVFGRMSQGFDPWREDLRAGETVRKGLLDGRNYVDTPSMRSLLSGKFENPILGLYAAHLLLIESPPKLEVILEVIQNTAAMLGEHFPDVVALSAAYAKLPGAMAPSMSIEGLAKEVNQLQGPPLLSRSWDVLLEATKDLPSSTIASAALYKVAGDLVAQGVFLAWRRRFLGPDTPARHHPSQRGSQESRSKDQMGSVLDEELIWAPDALPASQGAIGILVGPAISAVTGFLKYVRRIRFKPDEPNLAAEIAEIDSNEEAADVLRELAKRYDWHNLLPWLRKNPEWLSRLSGLQRDIVFTLKDASIDPDAIEGLTGNFVARLLDTHRVPLASLVEALSAMELSGWMTSGVNRALEQAIDSAKSGRVRNISRRG